MSVKTLITALLSSCLMLALTNQVWAQTSTDSAAPVDQTEQPVDNSQHHPLRNDPTGINWAFSLEEAIQTARETNRIVALKPVAFQSKTDSDALSPSSESQRAIAFVDERVVNLLNHRFVIYYFDLQKPGSQYDEAAAKLAYELHPDMRYLSMATPPLLFMTPERKSLGQASNFLSSDELLESLVTVLNENPEYKELTTAEKLITEPIEKAKLHYELRDLEGAVQALARQQESEAYFLRLKIAREQRNWAAMKACVKLIPDLDLKASIDVENIVRYWQTDNLEGIKAKGARIAKDNPRYQEAMYYVALAEYHTDARDDAKETLLRAIEHDRESAWAIRLDLALGLIKLNPDKYLTPQDKIPSLLGRKFLCPNGLEDLSAK